MLLTLMLLAASPSLEGTWRSDQVLGPLLSGELTVDERSASLAGYQAPVTRSGDEVRAVFPNGLGELRGHLQEGGRVLRGAWVQPRGPVRDTPYATPLSLERVSARTQSWRGLVAPLPERISFTLTVHGNEAVLHNPELNLLRGRKFEVVQDAAGVALKAGKDVVHGRLESGVLRLEVLENVPALAFAKGDEPAPRQQSWAAPLLRKDGWTVGTPGEVGLDPAPLQEVIENAPPQLQGLLVARHGKLVVEAYFDGFSVDRAHDLRSAGKTLATILVGIGRDRRRLALQPETRLGALFPELMPFAAMDERKAAMTLEDLMTMRSGLACNEDDDNSPGGEDRMQSQTAQPDWYRFALDLPMAAAPGGAKGVYCSSDLNLAAGAVHFATGAWLPELFDDYLGRPLQMEDYHLNLMPTGEAYFGGGASLRPRDMLKLGQLYLSGGTWNGRRVVSREWVTRSLQPRAEMEAYFGVEHKYGYGWHLYRLPANGRTYAAYGAGGNGGQMVIVVPELDLVVATTGGAYGEFKTWYRWLTELIPQHVLAAAK